jgi:hypothetical protein
VEQPQASHFVKATLTFGHIQDENVNFHFSCDPVYFSQNNKLLNHSGRDKSSDTFPGIVKNRVEWVFFPTQPFF